MTRHWAAGVVAAVVIGALGGGPARGAELTRRRPAARPDRLARGARDRARQPLEPERAGARAALAARPLQPVGHHRLRGRGQHPARRAGDRADEGRHLQLPQRVPERVAVGAVRGRLRRPHVRRPRPAPRHAEVRLGQARPHPAHRRAQRRALLRSLPARRGGAQDRRAGGPGVVLPAAARLDPGGVAADGDLDPAVLPVPLPAPRRALVSARRRAAEHASRCRR